MLKKYKNFEILNSGRYHDVKHALLVSKIAGKMAKAAGFCRKTCRFLAQVALIHDADERLHPATGQRDPLLPPRVGNTLEWTYQNEDYLCRHFSWTRANLNLARAVIARTSYPFDKTARFDTSRFAGLSPVEVLDRQMTTLAPELRKEALQLGLILRFADQIANYSGPWRRLQSSVAGLVEELRANGVEVCSEDLDTATFLAEVGTDLAHDKVAALKFGLTKDALYTREDLLSFLPNDVRRRLENNLDALQSRRQAA